MSVSSEAFGKNQFGENVTLYTLNNSCGMTVRIMDHGGTIISIVVPDSFGNLDDVVLGHGTAEEYIQDTPYFGSAIGRYANRINEGKFLLDGVEYQLACNNGPNALHGGLRGFDKVVWDTEVIGAENAIKMSYVSIDGEEGFPGELATTLTYTLTEQNELKIHYQAETTKPTPVNFTNHSYFNLAGHDAGKISDQVMSINANSFLPSDETAIPFGDEMRVQNTPFDFLTPKAIGEDIDAADEQIRFGGGYDHNFCLNKEQFGELSFAARAEDPESGRIMEVFTTEPGIQFYTGNFLDGSVRGKGGCAYAKQGAYCLETQGYPDAPNQTQFPNTIVRPGDTFRSQTIYRFSAR